jgi:hypothetical protein
MIFKGTLIFFSDRCQGTAHERARSGHTSCDSFARTIEDLLRTGGASQGSLHTSHHTNIVWMVAMNIRCC